MQSYKILAKFHDIEVINFEKLFPYLERSCYLCKVILIDMDNQIFRLITLSEAIEFLDSLPDNVREKVLYNIRKVRGGIKDI